jgi:hypothetical protein
MADLRLQNCVRRFSTADRGRGGSAAQVVARRLRGQALKGLERVLYDASRSAERTYQSPNPARGHFQSGRPDFDAVRPRGGARR